MLYLVDMKKKEGYNEYMRVYMANRYHEIRNKIISNLGGKCFICKSDKNIEIDHVISKNKTMSVARICGVSEKRRKKELENCQLLCKSCHEEKTITDCGNSRAKGIHGTLSSYRYCRCEKCRLAKNIWTKEYRKKYGRKKYASLAQQ